MRGLIKKQPMKSSQSELVTRWESSLSRTGAIITAGGLRVQQYYKFGSSIRSVALDHRRFFPFKALPAAAALLTYYIYETCVCVCDVL